MSVRKEQFLIEGSLKACRPAIPVDTMVGDEYTPIYENCFSKYKEAVYFAYQIIQDNDKKKGVISQSKA